MFSGNGYVKTLIDFTNYCDDIEGIDDFVVEEGFCRGEIDVFVEFG